ncbi:MULTISPECIES: SAM-dependent methyltransferase [unclassified Streptomyces]|uniref:SAM-dependent methyltransferase n=1 Tax=unclassified Streptomyces TaxID=2593676 RepID=UPI002DDC4A2A|nr:MULTISPECIES: SAM-dependent methyltransferase [unclassified Streptomyces]WSA91993.1 SAM-dependent methyltransferase [Streptomyces sp. NBC_01795]WSB76360.1 SAM-dependent methyltransferase [Streptomyces sp. NBC_01775]WSS15365.1 SAM-dependent methyltransferase [Streptomyces sp. NBC_01186]WSS44210.1 SAM-dependent methyltransferase [Streptomyces sp. NBC_01187]
MTGDPAASRSIDTSRPHGARIYDYLLGGKTYFDVDVQAGEDLLKVLPTARSVTRTNRDFMARVTRTLAAEYGVRQFLDIGTGIPTEPNLHQVAQRVAPECRVVYTDNDPIVLEHARALMRGDAQGRTAYLPADVRDPDRILRSEAVRRVLDFERPVALSLLALLHFLPDGDGPYEIVTRLRDALPPGSFLVLSHCTADFAPEAMAEGVRIYHERGMHTQVRTEAEIRRFFGDAAFLEPGLVMPHQWRPDPDTEVLTPAESSFYAGVARTP